MAQPISQILNADGTATVMFDDGSTHTMAPNATGGMLATVPIAGTPDVIPAAAPAAAPPPEAAPPAWLSGPAMAGGPRPATMPQAIRDEVAAADARAAQEAAKAKADYEAREASMTPAGGKVGGAPVDPSKFNEKLTVPGRAAAELLNAYDPNKPKPEMVGGTPVADFAGPRNDVPEAPDWGAAMPSGGGGGGVRRVAAHFADAGGQRTIYSPDTVAARNAGLAEQAAGGQDYARRLYGLAEAEAEAHAGLRQDLALTEQRMQDIARRRDEEVAKAQRDIEATGRDIAQTKIDPGAVWHRVGAAGQLAAAIGVAMAQFGQAIARTGGPNPALAIINKTIDDDVSAQVANLNNKQRGLENQKSLYGQMLAKYGDEQAAVSATKAALYESTKLKAAELASKRKGVDADKGLSDLMAGLQDKQTQFLAETQGVIKQAYQPERLIQYGSGVTPAQMIARRAAAASGGDPVRAQKIAFDLARANGMSEKVANEAGGIAASGVSLQRGMSSQDLVGDDKAATDARREAYKAGAIDQAKDRAVGPKKDGSVEKQIATLIEAQNNIKAMSEAAGGYTDRLRRSSPGVGDIKTQADQDYKINRGMLVGNLKRGLNLRQVPDELLPSADPPGASSIPQKIAGTGKLAILNQRLGEKIKALREQQARGGAAPDMARTEIDEQAPEAWAAAGDDGGE